MLKTFFCIKRGDHLTLGSLPDRVVPSSPVDSPRPFFNTSPGALMKINPLYENVPYLQEKLKVLKIHIDCDRSAIALWESEMPRYYLLPKVKEQLERNLKMWADITGGQPCQ